MLSLHFSGKDSVEVSILNVIGFNFGTSTKITLRFSYVNDTLYLYLFQLFYFVT